MTTPTTPDKSAPEKGMPPQILFGYDNHEGKSCAIMSVRDSGGYVHVFAQVQGAVADLLNAAWNTRTPAQETGQQDAELEEIRGRWKSRSWPSIGYFVHGEAYQDIHKLLEIIDGK